MHGLFRVGWIMGFLLGALAVPAAPAAADDGARAVIDRAIRAHGGERRLAEASRVSRAGSGTQRQGVEEVKFATEMLLDLPDRIRLEITLDGRFKILMVINGDKGWVRTASTQALPEGRVRELREEAYAWWVSTLVPLTREEFTLRALPDGRSDGKAVSVVRASRKGWPDVTLSFDKGSGLLVKMERPGTEAGLKVDKAYLFDNHRTFDGVKVPTHEVTTLNGRKWSDVTFESYTFPDEIDKEKFEKP
jgi:hypothetical protein